MSVKRDRTEEEIPVVWTRPHHSSHDPYMRTIKVLLDKFVERYKERLHMRKLEIHVEAPKNAAGTSKEDVIIKLHITLRTGEILIAQSERKNATEAMKDISHEIDHQTHLSDRQKHKDTTRKVGDEFST